MKDFALIYVMTLIMLYVAGFLGLVFHVWAIAIPIAAVIYGFISQSHHIEELKRRVQELEGKRTEEETADAENV